MNISELVSPVTTEALRAPVSKLTLSVRARNCLSRASIRTVEDLLQMDEKALLQIKNLGHKSLKEIRAELERFLRNPDSTVNQDAGSKWVKVPSSELHLSTRAANCLKRARIETIGDLLSIEDADLMRLKGVGRTVLDEIKCELKSYLDFSAGVTQERSLYSVAKESDKAALERAMEVKGLYDRLGTYELVGKELGLTRERVRQILRKGTLRGWFVLEIHGKKRWTKKLLGLERKLVQKELQERGSLGAVAKHIDVPVGALRAWCDARGLDPAQIVSEHKERRVLDEYKEVVGELGYHPSTTVLQSRKKWRALAMRIQRLWGSTRAFRRSFRIEPNLVKDRPWIHRKAK